MQRGNRFLPAPCARRAAALPSCLSAEEEDLLSIRTGKMIDGTHVYAYRNTNFKKVILRDIAGEATVSGRRNTRPVPIEANMADMRLAWMEIYKSVPCLSHNFSKYTRLLSATAAPAPIFAKPQRSPAHSQKRRNRYFIVPYSGAARSKSYIYKELYYIL
jgi:hypothetical protein